VTGDLIYNETYYGYSASEHPDGVLLTCYLALVLGSRLAIWLVLVTSGEFGFEREVIEKINIDSIPIPEFERLGTAERAQIERLFAILVERDDDSSWAKIDAWVYSLYGLTDRDIGVVEDTLAYNSPYMESRKRAQTPPTGRPARRIPHSFVSGTGGVERAVPAGPHCRLRAMWTPRSMAIRGGWGESRRGNPGSLSGGAHPSRG
jgi:hypothetical protein